jgi:hypothetical protein
MTYVEGEIYDQEKIDEDLFIDYALGGKSYRAWGTRIIVIFGISLMMSG